MKVFQKSAATLTLIVLSSSLIGAQDLTKYRNFSMGASLASISKLVDTRLNEVSVTHQAPVLIQELIWWPVASSGSSRKPESIEQVKFSFCDNELYKIVATYDETPTKGMTADDMVQAISTTYGIPTRSTDDPSGASRLSYAGADVQVAVWENAESSVVLSHSPVSSAFQLTLLSKPRNAKAEAGIAEDVKQETESAPQKETARIKKDADDLEALRQANLKSFKP